MPLHPTIPTVCKQCGRTFFLHPSRIGIRYFCSRECYYGSLRTPIEDRFWGKVAIVGADECWVWQAARLASGYGVASMNGRNVVAHRIAYTLTHGAIPEGLQILHSCDNRLCCNPNHLRAGTQVENMQDMYTRNRQGVVTKPESIQRGTQQHAAKLTEDDVRSIREKYAAGTYTYASLAAAYHVSISVVGLIVQRKAWRHVL